MRDLRHRGCSSATAPDFASANSRGAWCASFRKRSYRRRTRSSRCAPALSPAAVDAAAAVAVAAAAAAASAAAAADVAAVAAGAVAGTGAGEREVRGISFDGFAVSRMLLLLSAKAKVCC